MFHAHTYIFQIPIIMSNTPGRNVNFCNHFIFDKTVPSFIPINKNKELIIATNIAIIAGAYPNKDAPIPAPNESTERAIPRSNASPAEMVPDLSKSATVGFREIRITNPSEAISNFQTFSSCFGSSFSHFEKIDIIPKSLFQ